MPNNLMQSDLAYLEKVQAVLQAHSEKLALLANLSSLTHQRERYPHTANLLDKLMACSLSSLNSKQIVL